MRRDVTLTITLDRNTADELKRLAESSAEGNRSLAVRQLVRKQAELAATKRDEQRADETKEGRA